MEPGVQQVSMEKSLLTTLIQQWVLTSTCDLVSDLMAIDKWFETVEPQYIGFAMKVGLEIFSCMIAGLSELKHDCNPLLEKWSS